MEAAGTILDLSTQLVLTFFLVHRQSYGYLFHHAEDFSLAKINKGFVGRPQPPQKTIAVAKTFSATAHLEQLPSLPSANIVIILGSNALVQIQQEEA